MWTDGSHIAGLLLGFFMQYAPWYLENGEIFLFTTPLITVAEKNGKLLKNLFTMPEYEKFLTANDPNGTKFIYNYMKGLGSLSAEDWKFLFQQYKLTDLLMPLHTEDSSDTEGEFKELKSWLSDDSQFRKDKILTKIADFDINSI